MNVLSRLPFRRFLLGSLFLVFASTLGTSVAYACYEKCELMGTYRCAVSDRWTGRTNCRTDGVSTCRFWYCV